MPRTRALNQAKRSSTAARQHDSGPIRRRRKSRGGILSTSRRVLHLAFPLVVVLTPVLILSFSTGVRNWALGALGYGFIPVISWLACFVLAARYKHDWIKEFWRIWAGAAILVAVSLGVMSMFHASTGVMEKASLGGHWGQVLGGSPIALGLLKVAVLVFLIPPLLYPRSAGTFYKRVGAKFLRSFATSARWLGRTLGGSARTLAIQLFSTVHGQKEDKSVQDESIAARKAWKSVFKVRRARSGVPGVTLPESPGVPEDDVDDQKARVEEPAYGWQLPPLELLVRGQSHSTPQPILWQMARHIEATLAEHSLEVAIEDIRTGPRVIRFGLVPGWVKRYRESRGFQSRETSALNTEMSRVKVQSILVREKDLALALKTPYLRLEAPVPGEAMVGLEVPNPSPRTVALRSLVESTPFQKIAAKGGLPVAMGEDTGGAPVVQDLSDLPHLLIAGATGSGKSVCINSVVASLIMTNRPDRLRMLMVDPKRVELTPFNGIPHLIAPVIVDTDEVLVVLRAIQNEMLHRYKLMEESGVRNIEGYNRKISERMPFLVIVIDELADLMMAAAYEVEQSLVRLAQLGRATGIHLILATQRPSVNVVTGLLKANIPARVAFAVASQVDSRVILDTVGAERLLGKGDMLMLAPDSPKPRRVQGAFAHEREIEKLVEFWQIQSGPPLPGIPLDERPHAAFDEEDGGEDDLLGKARELASRYRRISPSVLQRRLRIGYPVAMRLTETLEDEGLIPPSGERGGGLGERRIPMEFK